MSLNVGGRGRSPSWTEKRDTLREHFQPANQDCLPKHELLRHVISRSARMLLISLLIETGCVFAAPLTFPFLSAMFCHTLRVSRELSLTVPDHQRQLGKCILFPAPPVGWACSSFQCLTQPFVYCSSAALKPFLERSFRQSSHSFRQRLAVNANTYHYRKNHRRAFLRPQTRAPLRTRFPSPSC